MTPTSTTSSASAPMGGAGQLMLCATPIGNLGDITQRVLQQLGSADVVYAEDTRVTGKLLSSFGISVRVERCDENVMAQRIPQIVQRVQQGQVVAFVSDAGMPCISDPGQRLVAAMREAELPVTVLPGASAVLTAVAGSGFAGKSFFFGGFLPRKNGERARLLQQLASLDALLVFYESNHRTVGSLRAIAQELPGRRVCMARELTKLHEEYAIAQANQLADQLEQRDGELRGEVVLVVEAPPKGENGLAEPDNRDPEQMLAVAAELSQQPGMSASKVAKELVQRFGITREQAYEVARSAKS